MEVIIITGGTNKNYQLKTSEDGSHKKEKELLLSTLIKNDVTSIHL